MRPVNRMLCGALSIKPQGVATWGWPVRLVICSVAEPVGVTSTSQFRMNISICCCSSVRARIARMYSTAGIRREVRKLLGPTPASLPAELMAAPVASNIVESRGGLGAENNPRRARLRLRKLRCFQLRAGLSQRIQRVVVDLLSRFSLLWLLSRPFKLSFQVPDFQTRERHRGIPVEGRVDCGNVVAVGTVHRIQHQRAILHRAADRADLVHGPAQAHRAVPAYPAVSRTQADRKSVV